MRLLNPESFAGPAFNQSFSLSVYTRAPTSLTSDELASTSRHLALVDVGVDTVVDAGLSDIETLAASLENAQVVLSNQGGTVLLKRHYHYQHYLSATTWRLCRFVCASLCIQI
ncbi:MAG: hypothetical protein AAFQ63_10715 [Cyanobacteria bacterium J06621_11]